MLKKIVTILTLLYAANSYAQNYVLKNEILIFSFDTKNGKHMTIAKDTANKYIIYRFGTKSKVEFEFPGKTKNSWAQFKYSFYLRGGGIQNEGMDLNYFRFSKNNFKYVVYDTYYANGNKNEIGIRVTDINTNKTTDIKGNYKTRKGTFIDFRDNKLVEIDDELID